MELSAELPKPSSDTPKCRIEVEEITKEIFKLRTFGNKILTKSDLSSILNDVFDLIHSRLEVQVASIFLFSKDGYIERAGISGKDQHGQEIPDSWLKDEKYRPGQNFSGKAVKGNPYGETNWSNNLEQEIENFKFGKEYTEKLGRLECGISVPLNGTHRTFGTIEVINKSEPGGRFNEAETCWLTVLGGHVAMALSKLRARKKDELFSYISKVLADPEYDLPKVYSKEDNSNDSSKSVYKIVAEQLVSPLTPYKACIIRLSFDGKSVSVVDAAHHEGEAGLDGRHDGDRLAGQGIVGEVFRTGNYEIVKNIKESKKKFLNSKWIDEKKLNAYICFPLTVLGNTIGTISLFIGYEYSFDESDIAFLRNVSYLLGTFKIRSDRVKNSEEIKNKVKQIVHISLESILKSIRIYVDHHRYKDAVALAEGALRTCEDYVSEIDDIEIFQQIQASASYLELAKDLYKEKSISQD